MGFLSFTVGLIVGVVSTTGYFHYRADIDGLLSQTELM